jgi:hypothetical protein
MFLLISQAILLDSNAKSILMRIASFCKIWLESCVMGDVVVVGAVVVVWVVASIMGAVDINSLSLDCHSPYATCLMETAVSRRHVDAR